MYANPECALTYRDLLTGYFPAPAPIIDGFVEEGTVANWSGLWGAGKTWLALCAARAVASGTTFLCHFPTRQGKVLMIDQENTPGGIQARLKALEAALPLGPDLPISFRFVHGVRIDELPGFQIIDRVIGEEQPALVFFDSWIRFMAVNENNAVAVAQVNENIRSLVLQHGCAIVLLDHIRKRPPGGVTDDPADRTRGSGEKVGFVENALTIERSRDDRDALIVHPLKRRYGELLSAFRVGFEVDPATGGVALRYRGDAGAEETIGKPGLVVQAIAALQRQWGEDAADVQAIRVWLEWSESTTRRVLRGMVEAGQLRARTVRPRGGRGTNRTVYEVVEDR